MLQTLIQKRSNGYYYFRWVFPSDLRKKFGKRELIKSLHTTSKSQALARAGAYYVAVEELKNLCGENSSDHNLAELTRLYESDIPRLFETALMCAERHKSPYLSFVERETKSLISTMNKHKVAKTNFEGEYEEGKTIFALTEQVIKVCAGISIPGMDKMFSTSGIETLMFLESVYKQELIDELRSKSPLKDDYFFYMSISAWIHRAIGEYGKKFEAAPELHARYVRDSADLFYIMSHRKYKRLDIQQAVPELPSIMRAREVVQSVSPVVAKSILFSELFDKFLAFKQATVNLTQRMSKSYEDYFSIILYFIGDLPIEQIKPKVIKACMQKYSKLPKRNVSPYRGKSIQEIEIMDIPDSDLIASKTVKDAMKMLQGMFSYAAEHDLIERSPAKDVKLDLRVDEGRGRFSNEQVRTLLKEAKLQKVEWKKWIVRLGCYTGARLGELVQLRVEDIKIEEGIYYLLITPAAGSLKTENAFRRVPLHSKLIELGFLDFIGNGSGRIFPNDLTSHKITKWFTPFKENVGIPKTTEFNETLSFHSLRHSFITECRAAGIPDSHLQQVVGHSVTSAGLTDNYTSRFSVKVLQPVVEAVQY